MKEKSIIIIGAGLAGLSAGCYARMNGYKTHIVEMHTIPGGLCTSWNRKGYVFDGSIHYLTGSGSGIHHQFYEELGATQGREMIDNEELLRIEWSDGKTWTVYSDLDRLEGHMKELSPADMGIIEELCSNARRLIDYNLPLEKPINQMGLLDMVKLIKGIPLMRVMGRYGKISMREFAAGFKDPFLREVFPLVIEDLPGMSMMGVLFVLANLHIKNNGWPIGGSLEFSRAIEKRFLDLGGEIEYKSRVEKILVEEDRAVGVRLADGTEQRADMVISAADGRTTIFDMLDGKFVNSKIRRCYDEWPIYEPYIQISLGVARDLSDEPHSLVLKFDDPVDLGNETRDWVAVKHYCYDKTMAPAGKSVVTASFLFVSYEYWKDLYKEKERYSDAKQALANTVIDRLETRFPGLKDQIEVVDVATPVTYERYTGNWRGSYMGWNGMPTETGKWMSNRLPGLKNFYMAGQWVFPGGGVPGAITSGRHLIQNICKKDKIRFEAPVP